MPDQNQNPAGMDFINLVLTLSSSAAMYLGETQNPIKKKVVIDLAKARSTINMLVALKEKAKGNLNVEENKLLNDVIDDLERKYVESLDLDEAVLKTLRRRTPGAPGKTGGVQDWIRLVKTKQQEQERK